MKRECDVFILRSSKSNKKKVQLRPEENSALFLSGLSKAENAFRETANAFTALDKKNKIHVHLRLPTFRDKFGNGTMKLEDHHIDTNTITASVMLCKNIIQEVAPDLPVGNMLEDLDKIEDEAQKQDERILREKLPAQRWLLRL